MTSILIRAEPGLQFDEVRVRAVLARLIDQKLKDRDIELSLMVVGPVTSRRLNREYRQKDAPTTILEFSQVEKKAAGDSFVSSPGGRVYLGDLVLCPAQAEILAQKEGVGIETEIERLLVHGLNNLFKAAGLG